MDLFIRISVNLLLVVALAKALTVSQLCERRNFGYKVQDPEDCHSFYVCLGNLGQYNLGCGLGYRFDEMQQRCIEGKCPPCFCGKNSLDNDVEASGYIPALSVIFLINTNNNGQLAKAFSTEDNLKLSQINANSKSIINKTANKLSNVTSRVLSRDFNTAPTKNINSSFPLSLLPTFHELNKTSKLLLSRVTNSENLNLLLSELSSEIPSTLESSQFLTNGSTSPDTTDKLTTKVLLSSEINTETTVSHEPTTQTADLTAGTAFTDTTIAYLTELTTRLSDISTTQPSTNAEATSEAVETTRETSELSTLAIYTAFPTESVTQLPAETTRETAELSTLETQTTFPTESKTKLPEESTTKMTDKSDITTESLAGITTTTSADTNLDLATEFSTTNLQEKTTELFTTTTTFTTQQPVKMRTTTKYITTESTKELSAASTTIELTAQTIQSPIETTTETKIPTETFTESTSQSQQMTLSPTITQTTELSIEATTKNTTTNTTEIPIETSTETTTFLATQYTTTTNLPAEVTTQAPATNIPTTKTKLTTETTTHDVTQTTEAQELTEDTTTSITETITSITKIPSTTEATAESTLTTIALSSTITTTKTTLCTTKATTTKCRIPLTTTTTKPIVACNKLQSQQLTTKAQYKISSHDDHSADINSICAQHEDVYFVKHPKQCNKYYSCYKKRAYLQTCPGQFHFDDKLKMCNYPDVVDCEIENRRSRAKAKGPNPKYQTQLLVEKIQNSSFGLKPADCKTLKSGTFIRDANNCNKYYVCLNGSAVALYCPRGQYFDIKNYVCNFRALVKNCVV